MLAYKKRPSELLIWDDDCQIIFEPGELKYIDGDWDEDYWVDVFDGNLVEISFRQDEPDGWGLGGGEYITTTDIKAMADCIRSVINGERPSARYSCLEDLFRIELTYDALCDRYTFSVELLEILMRDHYVSVAKRDLSREELDEYISPFFIWEKDFPIIEGDGKVYERTWNEERSKMPKPFCDETILKTYRMQVGFGDEELWIRPDYHQIGELVYHAVPGYWLVFETEHFYISIGADGVNKYETLEQLKGDDRELWNDFVTGVEEVVFSGDHIEHVVKAEIGWNIAFSHFHMLVIPHEKDDSFVDPEYQVEKPFFGFSHILNKCICGGRPEFKMDRHGDFYVQCPICDRYTDENYNADVPVEDWNTGEVRCVPGHDDITRIFIRLDGVLADFDRGVAELCHITPVRKGGKMTATQEDLMWSEIKKVEHFYKKLEFVPGAKEMFDMIYARYGKRCEIIADLPHPGRRIVGSRRDRIEWIRENLSKDIKVNITITDDNHDFSSGSNCVLIDTKRKSIKDWEIYDGVGVLFTDAENTMKALKEKGLI